jgi:hypothetical protein
MPATETAYAGGVSSAAWNALIAASRFAMTISFASPSNWRRSITTTKLLPPVHASDLKSDFHDSPYRCGCPNLKALCITVIKAVSGRALPQEFEHGDDPSKARSYHERRATSHPVLQILPLK